MSSVPAEARTRFVELSQTKFCNQWGVTLSYLIEMYDVWFPKLFEYESRIAKLEEMIAKLSHLLEEEKNVKKSISGKVLKR